MSWICHFLVGNKAQAITFCEAKTWDEKSLIELYRVETRNWNTALLTSLVQTINDETIDVEQAESIKLVYGTEQDVPWLWPVPDDIVKHLNAQSVGELSKLAKLWLSRDTLLPSYSLCTTKQLKCMLVELQQASILAQHGAKPLSVFLHVC